MGPTRRDGAAPLYGGVDVCLLHTQEPTSAESLGECYKLVNSEPNYLIARRLLGVFGSFFITNSAMTAAGFSRPIYCFDFWRGMTSADTAISGGWRRGNGAADGRLGLRNIQSPEMY